jgi:hypothetical protein
VKRPTPSRLFVLLAALLASVAVVDQASLVLWRRAVSQHFRNLSAHAAYVRGDLVSALRGKGPLPLIVADLPGGEHAFLLSTPGFLARPSNLRFREKRGVTMEFYPPPTAFTARLFPRVPRQRGPGIIPPLVFHRLTIDVRLDAASRSIVLELRDRPAPYGAVQVLEKHVIPLSEPQPAP